MTSVVSERSLEEAIECALLQNGPDAPVRSVVVGAHWTAPPLLGIKRCLPGFDVRADARTGCYARRSQA